MAKRNWIVSLSQEMDNPFIMGPYTERRAQQVAEAINKRNERRSDEDKLGDFLYASAYPIRNYGVRDAIREIFKGR